MLRDNKFNEAALQSDSGRQEGNKSNVKRDFRDLLHVVSFKQATATPLGIRVLLLLVKSYENNILVEHLSNEISLRINFF